jgi:hypothetical protein
MNHDKLFALENKLSVVEENDWYNPIRAPEIYLVPKDFKVTDFVKYTGLYPT